MHLRYFTTELAKRALGGGSGPGPIPSSDQSASGGQSTSKAAFVVIGIAVVAVFASMSWWKQRSDRRRASLEARSRAEAEKSADDSFTPRLWDVYVSDAATDSPDCISWKSWKPLSATFVLHPKSPGKIDNCHSTSIQRHSNKHRTNHEQTDDLDYSRTVIGPSPNRLKVSVLIAMPSSNSSRYRPSLDGREDDKSIIPSGSIEGNVSLMLGNTEVFYCRDEG